MSLIKVANSDIDHTVQQGEVMNGVVCVDVNDGKQKAAADKCLRLVCLSVFCPSIGTLRGPIRRNAGRDIFHSQQPYL